MPSIVDCSRCGRKLRVPDELLGQWVQCPECGNTFAAQLAPVVPQSPSASTPSPPAPGETQIKLSLDDDAPPTPRVPPTPSAPSVPDRPLPRAADPEDWEMSHCLACGES